MKTETKIKKDWKTLKWDLLTDKQKKNQWANREEGGENSQHVSYVKEMLAQLKSEGDVGLKRYVEKYDGVDGALLGNFRLEKSEIAKSYALLDAADVESLKISFANIKKFHERDIPQGFSVETMPGVSCGKKVVPLQAVGLYIPGGKTPLASTVLMLGVPALLAKCPRVALFTPPQADNTIAAAILVAADLCGIDEIYKLGGVASIAAMSYGSESIAKVDKIFGPGNSFVTTAKMIVSAERGGPLIDMPAGPSEVMVLADQAANPLFVAMDLLAQAEHGPDSQVVLVSDSPSLIAATQQTIEQLLEQDIARKDLLLASLENALFVEVENITEMVEVANLYASEHLIVQVGGKVEEEKILADIINAGSVFLGPWSPESVGDYSSGTNHVLPTSGYARTHSGVGVEAFVKKISFQSLTADGLRALGPTVERMARLEGLAAHEKAVTVRLQSLKDLKEQKK
jgi:histidinol dehydrogenase